MMPVCIKDLGQCSTSITGFQYWKTRHMHPQDILYHPTNFKRKYCVLGSGLKTSKSKLIKTKVVFILRETAV